MFLSDSILVEGSIDDCFQLLDRNAIAFGPGGDVDEQRASAIGMWQAAGLLPATVGEERALRLSLGFDLIAFRNDPAIFEPWADLAAMAGGRELPMPDEIAALAVLPENGAFTIASADWFHSHRRPSPEAGFVHVTDDDLTRDDRACDCWGENEEAVIRAMASEIRIRRSITVVTRVHPETLEIFYRNWHAWRFPRGVPVKVIARGLEPADLSFVRPEEAEIQFLRSGAATDAAISQREIASLIETEHWILLDPHWYPLPGAELFMHEDWRDFDLVVAEQFASTADGPAGSAPELAPSFALVRTGFAGAAQPTSLPILATLARERNQRLPACDPQLMGWRHVGSPQDTELRE